jgi:hypothetical protein
MGLFIIGKIMGTIRVQNLYKNFILFNNKEDELIFFTYGLQVLIFINYMNGKSSLMNVSLING